MTFLQIETRDREVELHALDVVHRDATSIWVKIPDAAPVTFGRGTPRDPAAPHVQVVDELTMSRTHFAIARRPDGRFGLTDLGSTGGTFLEHDRVLSAKPHELRDGDLIYLGAPAMAVRMWFRSELHRVDELASAAVYRREGATSLLQVYLRREGGLVEVELRVPTRILPAPAPGRHKDYIVPEPAIIGSPPPADKDRGEGARCRVVRIEATRVFVTFDGIEPECSWLRILMPPDVEVGHALTIPGARRAPWRDPTAGNAWSD